MNTDDLFRELAPEEAEAAYADAPEAEYSTEEMNALVRKTFILIGAIPPAEMTDEEVAWHLRHVQRFAQSSGEPTAVTASIVNPDTE